MNILMVELTNHCNEDCWFCPHSKMVREKGFMNMDTVKQVISKIEPGSSIILNNLGESLLHPQFFEIVEMFDAASIGTMITTNACILDDIMVEKLIRSKLSSIRISVDFLQNADIIQPLLKDSRVYVSMKGVDRKAIVNFRDRYGANGVVTFLVDFAGQMEFNGDSPSEFNCVFLNSDSGVVLWDGSVCACCYDYEGYTILGDVSNIDNLHLQQKYDLCEKCNGLDLRSM